MYYIIYYDISILILAFLLNEAMYNFLWFEILQRLTCQFCGCSEGFHFSFVCGAKTRDDAASEAFTTCDTC